MPCSRRKLSAITLALLAMIPSAVFAQTSATNDPIGAQITPAIEGAMKAGNIPSLSIALVNKESVLWKGAFGYSNVLKKVPAETDTIYLIGSTFKAQSTMALLQLVDEGKIKLDDPVAQFIDPIKIEGEDSKNPIRVWHLLTHSSGLPVDFGPHSVWGFSAPDSIDDYLKRKLKVDRLPETKYEYSNTAYQLVAKIVETVGGMPYRSFIQTRLWERLKMNDTAFVPRPNQYERIAIPYTYNESKSKHTPTDRVKADVWAAGIVYGTIEDQAKWLITNLNRGEYDGERIIKKSTFKKMTSTQFHAKEMNFHALFGGPDATIGLTWWLKEENGEKHFAHSGSVPGYTAWITGNLDQGVGVAILTNGNRSHPHISKLADQALALLK